jgi:hypothetical protein
VFATAYWANVLHDLDVHDWQVHNEPDNSGQGWNGTLADYLVFTQYTADALEYVYDTYLPGESFRLYAPVSTHANEWITESLIANDGIIDVVDWHRYGPPYSEAATINGWIDQYDSDGVHEDLYLSEWGTYRGGYESHGSAMNYAGYLIDHSVDVPGHVASSAIFPLYDWSTQMTGLVFADGTKTATYWAFRLVARGLDGENTRYVIPEEPPRVHKWVAAKDEATNTMHVVLWSKGVKWDVVTIDVSAHVSSSTATLRKYAEGVNDEEIGTVPVTNGIAVVDLAPSSILLVSIPLSGGPGPTDTPPPPCYLHVGDIAMSSGQQGPFYRALATVTILDQYDAPVDAATVYGEFTGASTDSVSGDTVGDGTVTLQSSKVKNGGTWQFCVTDVTKAGCTYDEGANVETCDSITAP